MTVVFLPSQSSGKDLSQSTAKTVRQPAPSFEKVSGPHDLSLVSQNSYNFKIYYYSLEGTNESAENFLYRNRGKEYHH